MSQAKKGGQYGLNGLWYQGGQFLPSHKNSTPQPKATWVKKQKLDTIKICPKCNEKTTSLTQCCPSCTLEIKAELTQIRMNQENN